MAKKKASKKTEEAPRSARENQKITRLLPVELTDGEWRERSEELAQAELYRCQVSDELEAEKAVWAERKKLLESKVMTASSNCERLGRVVKERKEERAVECEAVVKGLMYTLVRLDTGEVVTVRAATPAELQLELPL